LAVCRKSEKRTIETYNAVVVGWVELCMWG